MPVRGVRGATTAEQDHPEVIRMATRTLLLAMLDANPDLVSDEIASIFFTVTEDISSEFPASAARELGWTQVPMLCAREIPVPSSLPRAIRVMLHWNTSHSQADIHHVYLGEAVRLRPDLVNGVDEPSGTLQLGGTL